MLFSQFILALPSLVLPELSFGMRPSDNVKGVDKRWPKIVFVFAFAYSTSSSLA